MEGWHGWDAYAAFYDWENARTVGRRDVRFWQKLIQTHPGPVLELGCGTGRVSIGVSRVAESLVGVDRSQAMLRLAIRRRRRSRRVGSLRFVRGDIRTLPFPSAFSFKVVMAPYGVLQSLVRDRDLRQALHSARRVLRPDGLFVIDLVPELPTWREYASHVTLRGRRGRSTRIRLVESVTQHPARGVTEFDQEFIEERAGQRRSTRFTLTFRTLSMRQMSGRLRRAGFRIERLEGDYRGGDWHPDAATWIIVATPNGSS
ncbi:MAG: class I SAM-dependent methyltransferase [Acidobacteriota bacterium]|nr:class I SAM-dependent methyltransferase [Acidobacteriota bacterium]